MLGTNGLILIYFSSIRPRVLPIPGAELENVFTLRTPDDANKIAENVAGKNVVIIGSSFIGKLSVSQSWPHQVKLCL